MIENSLSFTSRSSADFVVSPVGKEKIGNLQKAKDPEEACWISFWGLEKKTGKASELRHKFSWSSGS
jgi:hypothetical protein